jgi:hypothetical protein
MVTRKVEPTVQNRQTDKNSPEKSGFDFLGEFVLAEGLGGVAGQQEKRNRLFRTDRQIRIHPKSPGLTFLREFVLAEELEVHINAQLFLYSPKFKKVGHMNFIIKLSV